MHPLFLPLVLILKTDIEELAALFNHNQNHLMQVDAQEFLLLDVSEESTSSKDGVHRQGEAVDTNFPLMFLQLQITAK